MTRYFVIALLSFFSMLSVGIIPGTTEPSAKTSVGVPLMPFFWPA
jgi:hypothetical protein